MLTSVLALPLLLASLAIAAPVAKNADKDKDKADYPFKRVVAFGDNLSDNGNGSYSWCLAAPKKCDNSIYGHRTWTNGPVAVSYLVDMLDLPLAADYAVGHSFGGSKFGATIDNEYTNSTANVPSAVDQIANYTTNAALMDDISETLHFLWIGANDINLYHISTSSTNNSRFAAQFSSRLADAVESLITVGAKHVFVPNLYPKQISPSSQFYASSPTEVTNLGNAIIQANDAIKDALAPLGSGVIYYDVNTFMTTVWNKHNSYDISHVGGEFCDGYSQEAWDQCVMEHQGDSFYWMQYLDMTTRVHKLIAKDMFKTIRAHFA